MANHSTWIFTGPHKPEAQARNKRLASLALRVGVSSEPSLCQCSAERRDSLAHRRRRRKLIVGADRLNMQTDEPRARQSQARGRLVPPGGQVVEVANARDAGCSGNRGEIDSRTLLGQRAGRGELT